MSRKCLNYNFLDIRHDLPSDSIKPASCYLPYKKTTRQFEDTLTCIALAGFVYIALMVKLKTVYRHPYP